MDKYDCLRDGHIPVYKEVSKEERTNQWKGVYVQCWEECEICGEFLQDLT